MQLSITKNGKRYVLYGGYVYDPALGREKEIRAYGRAVDESDCGRGTDYVVRRIAKRAKLPVENVRETWRY